MGNKILERAKEEIKKGAKISKLKATASELHMIKAEIKYQIEELIDSLDSYESDKKKLLEMLDREYEGLDYLDKEIVYEMRVRKALEGIEILRLLSNAERKMVESLYVQLCIVEGMIKQIEKLIKK